MSDTQLYRQFDGRAFNSPFTAHKMKTKSNFSISNNNQTSAEIYSSDPRVRKSGPAAISSQHKKWPTSRNNTTFVPIPELGIYSPEQHVLQNGTYAQHCGHLREMNNNASNSSNIPNNGSECVTNHTQAVNGSSSGGRFDKKQHVTGPSSTVRNGFNSKNSHSRENKSPHSNSHNHGSNSQGYKSASVSNNINNYNSSLNSSFDESVSSYGYAPPKGVLRGYQPPGTSNTGNSRYANADVYHSCLDISHSHREGKTLYDDEFDTLNSRRSYDHPGYTTIKEEDTDKPLHNGVVSPRQSKNDMRNSGERGGPYRDDVRDEDSKMEPTARSASLGDLSAGLTFSLAPDKKAGSVTAVNQSNRKKGLSSPRLVPKSARQAPSTASISSNDKEEGSSALKHIRERLQKAVFKSHGDKRVNGTHNSLQNLNHQQNKPVAADHQVNRVNDRSSGKSFQRQISAPEDRQTSSNSPRRRRDSQETNSSYKSAYSSDSYHNNTQNSYQRNAHKTYNSNSNITNSSNSISTTLNNTDSSGTSFATVNSTATITNKNFNSMSTDVVNCNRDEREQSTASPSKPKRSLPNVPVSETSERIKRFTEIMRSRVSNSSRTGSSNGSRSGSSSKHTPTQMITDSTYPHTNLSRKPSMEAASDSEVFTINTTRDHNDHRGMPYAKNNFGRNDQNNYDGQNPRQCSKSIPHDNPHSNYNAHYNSHQTNNSHSNTQTSKHNVYNDISPSQCHQGQRGRSRPLTSEDTPLPLGDRSTDSGQTTGTNQSYNGSAMDSGYTTNNDADNESFNNNFHHQLLPQHQSINQNHVEGSTRQLYSHYSHNHHSNQQTQNHQHQPSHQQHPTYSVSPPRQHKSPRYKNSQELSIPQTLNGTAYRSESTEHKHYSERAISPHELTPYRQGSNLVNAHRFGSVQNVSSAQAHGNPHDNYLHALKESTPIDYTKHSSSSQSQKTYKGPHSAREYSTRQSSNKNGITKEYNNQPINGEHSSKAKDSSSIHSKQQNGRRSWDYSDMRLDEGHLFEPKPLGKSHRGSEHYRSTEVISSSKSLLTDANYVNTNHIKDLTDVQHNSKTLSLEEQSRLLTAKFKTMHLNNGNDPVSGLTTMSYHNGVTGANNTASQHNGNNRAANSGHSQSIRTINNSNNNHISHSYHSQNYNQQNNQDTKQQPYPQLPDRHQLHPSNNHHQSHQQLNTMSNNDNNGVVKLRPVPISRAHRNSRGRTLPGGFRFTDADVASVDNVTSTSSKANSGGHQEVMLFHLTQQYDLCPVLVNLPKHVSLKDVSDVTEFLVEISLVGIPGADPLGAPSSPQGPVASKIGSAGSAFSPVRNCQDFEGTGDPVHSAKITSATVNVIRFSRVWTEELQRHTTLGSLLEGDIVVEVNGWFCLGTDVTYLTQVVESCQGAVTFTVARIKESDEKRFKGQTPAERVKGLEAEISRLDEIIHSKEEKIRELTTSDRRHGSISIINGEVPTEGMVIGEDEYVV